VTETAHYDKNSTHCAWGLGLMQATFEEFLRFLNLLEMPFPTLALYST